MRKEERGVSRLGQGTVDCAKKEFRGSFKYLKSALSSFLWTHILPHKPMCEAQVLEESIHTVTAAFHSLPSPPGAQPELRVPDPQAHLDEIAGTHAKGSRTKWYTTRQSKRGDAQGKVSSEPHTVLQAHCAYRGAGSAQADAGTSVRSVLGRERGQQQRSGVVRPGP